MAIRLQTKNFLLIIRRSHAVATENLSKQAPVSVMKKGKEIKAEELGGDDQKHVFWMRDPKTGNWIPESHFDEIDVAELRDKFLSKTHH